MYLIFAIVAAPILFFLLTWVVVTVCRLYFPEEGMAPELQAPLAACQGAMAEGESLPVGVREIREDQRRHLHEEARTSYHYASGGSEGLPSRWVDDLWRRRN